MPAKPLYGGLTRIPSQEYVPMTGMKTSSAGLELRRRKALYRAWHRGIREMDLMLGGFADREIARMSEADLTLFEALLEELDSDLMAWIVGQRPVPARHDHAVLARIREDFRFHAD